jgi:hypothetical protein
MLDFGYFMALGLDGLGDRERPLRGFETASDHGGPIEPALPVPLLLNGLRGSDPYVRPTGYLRNALGGRGGASVVIAYPDRKNFNGFKGDGAGATAVSTG